MFRSAFFRIYCDSADSPKRRAIQTIFWLTVECFKLLLAPVLPYLTEEVEEVCARQWPVGAQAGQHSMSLLERVSDNKLVSAFSDPPNTDWMACMNMMRDWERHDVCADAVELVHRLYRSCIGVLESGLVAGSLEGSAVKRFHSSHISIICAPHQSNIHSCLEVGILFYLLHCIVRAAYSCLIFMFILSPGSVPT